MRVAFLAPTAVTLSALSCGATSIRWALGGDIEGAIVLLLVSAVLDGLDGHCARYLNAVSRFGAELDSLCDLVNFGLAPTFVVTAWASKGDELSGETVWLCALAYMCACACRLARFNVGIPPVRASVAKERAKREKAKKKTTDDPTMSYPAGRADKALASDLNPSFRLSRSKFFAGAPAPMMAVLILTPIFYEKAFETALGAGTAGPVAAVGFVVVAALGISEIPTLSSKMMSRDNAKATHLQIATNSSALVLLKASGIPLVLYGGYAMWGTWQLWSLAFVSCFIYIASLPAGVVLYYYFARP